MTDIFIKILNMSISASWVILAVLLLRVVLNKAPKWISVLLWVIVAVRLLCPFTLESPISLLPSAETVKPDMIVDAESTLETGMAAVNDSVNPVMIGSSAPEKGASANPVQIWFPIAANVWLLGVAIMVLYLGISYILLRKRVVTAFLLRDHLYQCDNIESAFVLGLFRPRIYLPFQISEPCLSHVIAHETAHIKRKDHWWKPLGFLVLTVHWFNPLVWLAYILLCRDIELACDEKVIKDLSVEARADYSAALLSCSVDRRLIVACPIAFGEISVGTRIKAVLHYKKPAIWIIIAAVVLCMIVAVCFLTDPIGSKGEPDLSYLNYENAIPFVADRQEVQVIYYPKTTDDTESFIHIGCVSGTDLVNYLDSCRWREITPPADRLSSPGSVEFVIEDEYRITVYDRRDWTFRQYVKVSYLGDTRYYAAQSSDYDTAVELIHPPIDQTDDQFDGQYHLLIGQEGVTQIEVTVAGNTKIQKNIAGLPFKKGEKVHIEALDGITDLKGVSVSAYNRSGEILHAFSVPTNATNKEIINTVNSDNWLLAPTVAIAAGEDGQFYHIISAEGVAELKLKSATFSGGCVHADGSVFQYGENVWLEPLADFTDLEDVVVSALDKEGNLIYSFLLIPKNEK